MDSSVARKTWRTLEPYHGLVYFAPEAAEAYAALGIEGFDGYFASRGAAFGEASAELVIATFFNFQPAVVRHALPAVWSVASPTAVQGARRAAIDAALGRLTDGAMPAADLDRALALIRPAAEATAASIAGRPLAAAHLALPWPEEPRVALWHAISVLREHRGDGHVACLTEAGIDGCEALVLHAATGEVPARILQGTRHWPDDDWAAAVDRLAGRGIVDADGGFTDAGRALRDGIEARTDALATPPWAAIGEDACAELRALVRPASKAIVSGGGLGR
jgi:hypothetical protein